MTCNPDSTTPLISLRDVEMSWDKRRVLSDITLSVMKGEFLAISGPNGGGKTTLLRIILGLIRQTGGSVEYHTADGRRPSTGYLPQKNSIDSNFPITVEEVVSSGLTGRHNHMSAPERMRAIERIIERIGLMSIRKSPIGEISGGQLQRAMIGRALVADPELIVMDEPLSYLDKHSESTIYDILNDLHRQERTIIVVSHELTALKNMADRLINVDHTLIFGNRP